MNRPGPIAMRTALAAVVATVGIVTAVVIDLPITSTLFAAAGVGLAIWLIGGVRSRDQQAALRGAAVVVASVLVVGLPAVVLLKDPVSRASGAAPDGTEKVTVGGEDPSSALVRALDRADQLTPGGSTSIMQITIGEDRESVRIFDARTGQSLTSYRSGDEWSAPSADRSSDRVVFSRADIRELDLNAAVKRVDAAREQIGYPAPTSSGGIDVGPRSADDKIVASFGVGSGVSIETDLRGQVADTVGAASVSEFPAVVDRAMRAAGLDPAAQLLTSIDFKTVDDAASWIGLAHPGFELELDGTTVYRIEVEPGRFPELHTSSSAPTSPPNGFSLTGLTGATMTKVRDDLARRRDVPPYDRDAVGAVIGVARNDDDDRDRLPVTIQMVVGPGDPDTGGVYSTRGRFLRDGTE
ncbi:hypothetical protein [Gordonia neofelifaecis]|uniref:Uncharacterized protein n=1 Tax=Gordonia neofelifaecis NRRL B-59395 TaxID=644548 RepID=F1YGG3_9ACTN|nr:hypothetical protein [Gordonia neofelifaecis]EGD56110.1 hypothetical protein SCNU_04601 [Gordonia neofelifaecis NRRL B-59395]